jgi:site-specific recombinase XerD
MIDQFCQHHESYNGITEDRIRLMRNVLRAFEGYLGHPVEEASHEEFQAWLATEIDRGLKASTVIKNARCVLPFFQWCWDQGTIDSDRMMRLRAVKLPRAVAGQPRPYDRRELRKFWKELEEKYPPVDDYYWRRWRKGTSHWRRVWTHAMLMQTNAIVALALDCGMRRSEVYDISIDDAHYDNEFVVVREGKGGRYREVPHTKASRAAMFTWLEMRAELRPPHKRIWLGLDPRITCTDNSGKRKQNVRHPLSEAKLGILFGRIGSGWELHRFRHTCGTEWLRAGMPLELVQKHLGHSNINMTLRYAKLVSSDVHAAASRHGERFARAVRPDTEAA